MTILAISRISLWGAKYGRSLYFATILFVAASAITSRLFFNGYIFDFDYHLYQPDGALYTYQVLKWTGLSDKSAALQVIDWYAKHAESGARYSLRLFDPSAAVTTWSLVNSRFLYSILSIPFVALFGIPGMLAIPIISFVTVFLLIAVWAWRMGSPMVGLLVTFLIGSSITASRWFIVNYTDSLLAALFAIVFIFLLTSNKEADTAWLYLITLVLIILTSATRFCLPYWLAIAAVYILRRRARFSIFIAITSFIGFLPSLISAKDLNAIVVSQENGVLQKLLYLPVSAIKILVVEGGQLALLDKPLLLLIVVAFLVAVTNRSALSSQLYISSALAGWLIGVLNGMLGVNFRYQLPLIPLAALVLIETVKINRVESGRLQIGFRS